MKILLNWQKKDAGFWLLILFCMFVLSLPLIGIFHVVDIPFWDGWDDNVKKLAVNLHDGGLSFHTLMLPHNHHRLFIQRMIYLLSYIFFNGSVYPVLLCSYFLTVGLCLMLYKMVKRTDENLFDHKYLLIAFLLASFFILCAANFRWAFLIEHVLGVFFFTLSVFILYVSDVINLRLVLLLCLSSILATLSVGPALAVWPAIAAYLIFKRAGLINIIIYLMVAIITILLYEHNNSAVIAPAAILDRVAYILIFFGSSFHLGHVIQLDVIMGSLFFLVIIRSFSLMYANKMLANYFQWYVLISLPLFVAIMGSLFRINFGINQGWSARYFIYSSLFLCGLVVLILASLPYMRRWERKLNKILFYSLLFISIFNFSGYKRFLSPDLGIQSIAVAREAIVNNVLTTPAVVYPSPNRIDDLVPFLHENHYSPFNIHVTTVVGKSLGLFDPAILPIKSSDSYPLIILKSTCWPRGCHYRNMQAGRFFNRVIVHSPSKILTGPLYLVDDNGVVWGQGILKKDKKKLHLIAYTVENNLHDDKPLYVVSSTSENGRTVLPIKILNKHNVTPKVVKDYT